jgi:hypothetical protein
MSEPDLSVLAIELGALPAVPSRQVLERALAVVAHITETRAPLGVVRRLVGLGAPTEPGIPASAEVDAALEQIHKLCAHAIALTAGKVGQNELAGLGVIRAALQWWKRVETRESVHARAAEMGRRWREGTPQPESVAPVLSIPAAGTHCWHDEAARERQDDMPVVCCRCGVRGAQRLDVWIAGTTHGRFAPASGTQRGTITVKWTGTGLPPCLGVPGEGPA